MENINITKCYSNFYPIGIFITANNLLGFMDKYNLTQEKRSEIKNSYFSQNLGQFIDSSSTIGGVIVSKAPITLDINST